MRKLLYGLLGVILIALAGFFLLVPGMAERDMNKIDGKNLIQMKTRLLGRLSIYRTKHEHDLIN